MRLLHCPLPLPQIESTGTVQASNQTPFITRALQQHCHAVSTGNVRLMRRPKDVDSQRFALSGKLADVCAALDELAAQETRNARRVAMH